jgi:glucose-6-phosphate 1-epimerase
MLMTPNITLDDSGSIPFLLIDNSLASCKVSLFGGHVISYIPKHDNRERLWMSPHAYLNGQRPIRGGIPVCWPWFSDDHGKAKGELPSHGFLRTQLWTLINSSQNSTGETVLQLAPTQVSGPGFPYKAEVTLTITVGTSLSVALTTTNNDTTPFSFNTALHTYFDVSDITKVALTGVYGDYKDKTDNWAIKPSPQPYTFTQETDRIHLAPIAEVSIMESEQLVTQIESIGNDSLVVWNPWQSAANIHDMDAFGFKHMLCVETSLTLGHTLVPSASHTLTQIIK